MPFHVSNGENLHNSPKDADLVGDTAESWTQVSRAPFFSTLSFFLPLLCGPLLAAMNNPSLRFSVVLEACPV